MVDATLDTTGATSPRPSGSTAPDTGATIRVIGPSFTTARATLQVDGVEIATAPQPAFHAFCVRALGKPARSWSDTAGSLEVECRPLTSYTAVTQNLAKAAMLVLVWLEPYLISGEARAVEHELIDELLVDYNAEPGIQRHIYFPPARIQTASRDAAIEQLYRSQHLCRLNFRMGAGAPIVRWFVPLVVPVLSAAVDASTRRTWHDLQAQMRDRVQRAVRR